MTDVLVAQAGTPEASGAAFVCDGSNDEVEINLAVAAAAASGGGTVHIAQGVYSLSAPVAVFDDNIHLEGAGASLTILRAASDFHGINAITGGELGGVVSFCAVDDFSCTGVTVDAVTNGVHSNGIIAIPDGALGAGNVSTNGVISDNEVYLIQAHDYSIWSLRGEHIEITGNLVDGGSTIASNSKSQEGIEVYGGDDVLISNNVVRNIGGSAINIAGVANTTPDSTISNTVIEHNTIESSRYGIHLATSYGMYGPQNLQDITVDDNHLSGITEIGIWGQNPEGDPSDPITVENLTISNNTIDMAVLPSGPLPSAIYLYNGLGDAIQFANIDITGNTTSQSYVTEALPNAGLPESNSAEVVILGYKNFSFEDNEITAAIPRTGSTGILVFVSSDFTIADNTTDGTGNFAIWVYGSTQFQITENSLLNWNQGNNPTAAVILDQVGDFDFLANEFATSMPSLAGVIRVGTTSGTANIAANAFTSPIDAQLVDVWTDILRLEDTAIVGIGNARNNSIFGTTANNSLFGGNGNDTLDGGAGNDTMTGDAGDDIYYVDSALDRAIEAVGGGSDRVYASVSFALEAGSEIETLSTDNDAGTTTINLTGNEFANILLGNAGSNVLNGKAGDDTMTGGAGDDIYYVDSALDRAIEAAGGGSDRVYASASFTLEAGSEIETLTTDNAAGAAAIDLTGNEFANTMLGNAGNNILSGGGGNDAISSFGGNDTLIGGTGIDTMAGGAGDDTYYVDSALDRAIEAAGGGNDRVYTGVSFTLEAGSEIETLSTDNDAGTTTINLTGNEFANILLGNAGSNVLNGKAGNDTMTGGAGNDIYYVDSALDRAIEAAGGGSDRVYASTSFTLEAGSEIETLTTDNAAGAAAIDLTGNEFANSILGNAGNNILSGGGGNDAISSFGGSDTLIGGIGIDTMAGGDGDDFYYVDSALDRAIEAVGGGNDQVYANVNFTLAAGSEIETLSTDNAAGTAAIDLTGNEFANSILGNAGNNILSGGGGNDAMSSFGGNDTLIGGTGIDTMAGGGDDDIYYIDSALDRAIEAAGGGSDRVYASASFTLEAGSEIETLTTDNAAGAAAIDLTGNEFANILLGNAGSNVLNGKAGNDTMTGGIGDDSYYVDSALDRAIEAAGGGNDRVYASASFTLEAGSEIETLSTDNDAGTTAINLTGNEFANILLGNAGSNVLNGKAGDDTMTGGAGGDIYYVDSALDRAIEAVGGGSDRVYASVSFSLEAGSEIETLSTDNDVGTAAINLTGNGFANNILGNAGSNVLNGKAGNDTMTGGAGDDIYYIDSALDRAIEAVGGGNDRVYTGASFTLEAGSEIETLSTDNDAGTTAIDLTGNEFANTLLGNAGSNVLNGKAGDDTMTGGAGDDSYYVDSALDRAIEAVGGGSDRVYASVSFSLEAGSEIETLTTDTDAGITAIDLTGNQFANILFGNAGNNVLNGGAGNDTMTGGAGDDIYYVDSALDRAIEAVGGGSDRVYASVTFTLEAGSEIETLSTDNDAGAAGIDLTGNQFANILLGNAGSNVLNGGAGNDTMTGGAGDDSYYVDSALDRAIEAAGGGNDRVYASVTFTLEGLSEIETLSTDNDAGITAINLTGNGFANILLGNAGNNVLNGKAGDDTMTGGAGNDIYYVDSALDRAIEAAGGGSDRVYASVSFTLAAGSEIETLSTDNAAGAAAIDLTGNEFANSVLGNAGNNILSGGGGNDAMSSFGGNDTLIGGTGIDTMAGGDGDDIYYVDSALDRAIEAVGGGSDRVYASVSFTLEGLSEIETLTTDNDAGTAAIDLTGNQFANILLGNAGSNVLNGKAGNDVLSGGLGPDVFRFDSALDAASNVDQITDFQPDDVIQLENAIFAGLAAGILTDAAFVVASAAQTAGNRIMYDNTTGALSYDPDGTGAAASTRFAILSPNLSLTHDLFAVT